MNRYKQSGIDHPSFQCIENGLPISVHQSRDETDKSPSASDLNRFSFFGQINQYKGLLILLKAVTILKQSNITNFLVIINGANLEIQPPDFQELFGDLLEQAGDLVLMAGSYNKEELKSRMLYSDWTILPSIWWENSPVVIQESFYFKRPVIASNIGGISEKIRGKGGIEFEVANPHSLAKTMEKCIGNVELHQTMQQQMGETFTAEACAEEHLKLYRKLLADPADNQSK